MDLGLQGAKVFVAASRTGLGAATARQFSLEGAIVAINGRHSDSLQVTAERIHAETGNPVHTIPADLTDAKASAEAVERAAAQMGGLDILMTNAGGPPSGRFEDFTAEQWQGAFDSLVMSVVTMVNAALPHLRQSKFPAILALTSTSLKEPIDNLMLSNVMRAGLAGLVKSLANQYGAEGIRVNAILPGWTETDRVTELLNANAQKQHTTFEALLQQRTQNIPLRRIGQPEEFAKVAVFLSSPAASFITGAMIPVDGGQIRATM